MAADGHAVRRTFLTQLSYGSRAMILVVEFLGEAKGKSIGEILSSESTDLSIWRFDPVGALSTRPDKPEYRELAQDCVTELMARTPDLHQPLIVVGYCSATQFSGEIAAEFGRRGFPPAERVLIRAIHPAMDAVWDEFVKLTSKLGHRGDFERPECWAADHRDRALEWLTPSIWQGSLAFARSAGLDEDEAAIVAQDVADRYLAWLWFLMCAADASSGTALLASSFPARCFPVTSGAEPGPGLSRWILDPHLAASTSD